MTPDFRICRTLLATALGAALTTPAFALEVVAGDYEVYPANVNIGLLYYQHATNSDLYVDGTKVSNRFDVTSDIGLARYIRPVQVADKVLVDLQAILPFGQVRGSDDARVLGRTSGVADLILGAPIKFLLDPTTRDAFSIGTFVYLPTGSYDHDRPINLGEHRYKGLLQLAYVKHFGATWALDTVADVEVHGKNTRFGPANATRKQDPRYEVQSHLRYNLSPVTALSVGAGHYWGGENQVNGIDQNDRLGTTYARLTAAHFIDQTTQVVAQLGRDVSVDNGTKEKARINLRIAKIF